MDTTVDYVLTVHKQCVCTVILSPRRFPGTVYSLCNTSRKSLELPTATAHRWASRTCNHLDNQAGKNRAGCPVTVSNYVSGKPSCQSGIHEYTGVHRLGSRDSIQKV